MNLAGQTFGEFEILEKLGEGGMGAVYKGRQSALKRIVAIKVLQPSLARDPEYVCRFNNEAVAAAALAHPNLVQVHAAGESNGVHWFAMEYVEGESVQKRVDRMGKLPPSEALAICIHVVAGLTYGWRKAQLIHRDIKPDNIFLSTDGDVKLGDLGLAKSLSQENSLTMTGASMGTPLYISPEQTEGRKDITFSTDIYSLGCMLFHLVSGQAPYHGDTPFSVMLKHVSAPIPDLRDACPDCPDTLAAVVQKMMSKSPNDRHSSYDELAADLQTAYSLLTPPDSPASGDPDTPAQDTHRSVQVDASSIAARKKTPRLLVPAIVSLLVIFSFLIAYKSGLLTPLKALDSARHQTVDLLALVDPARDRVMPGNLGKSNKWQKNGTVIAYVSDSKAGKIVPPVALNASEYELEIHYKRLSGDGQFHIDVPLPDEKIVPLILDRAGKKIVHERGLPEWPANLAPAGRILIHVKLGEGEELDTLGFELGDGRVLPSWTGRLREYARALEYHPDFPKKPMTSIFSMRDSYEFSKWKLTVLKGSVEVLR
jgi:serine/threonine protein kinase